MWIHEITFQLSWEQLCALAQSAPVYRRIIGGMVPDKKDRGGSKAPCCAPDVQARIESLWKPENENAYPPLR